MVFIYLPIAHVIIGFIIFFLTAWLDGKGKVHQDISESIAMIAVMWEVLIPLYVVWGVCVMFAKAYNAVKRFSAAGK